MPTNPRNVQIYSPGGAPVTVDGAVAATVAGSVAVTNIDAGSHAVHTIDRAHYEVHTGRTFVVSEYSTFGGGGGTITISIASAADKELHFIIDLAATAEATFSLRRNVTLDTPPGGTLITPANRRQTGTPPTSTTEARKDPTILAAGDELDRDILSAQRNRYKAVREEGQEWVIGPGQAWTLTLTFAGAGTGRIRCEWYELEA